MASIDGSPTAHRNGPRGVVIGEPPLGWGRVWWVSLAVWTILGVLSAGWEVLDVVARGRPAEAAWWEPAVWELSSAYASALLTPVVVLFTLRFRLTGGRWPRTLPAHLAAMVPFSLGHVGLMVGMRKIVYGLTGGSYAYDPLAFALPYEFLKDVTTFWALVGVIYGLDYYRRYREHELHAARLERELTQAKLESLQHRLHPHFLFNTLNTISSTMHEDPVTADRMLADLSDLLRSALDGDRRHEVTLAEEARTLERYLDIMRARFADRLQAEVTLAPETPDALVPVLLLQPLVENAVRHGISHRTEGGRVEVRAQRRGGRLRVEVEDDGPGIDAPDTGPARQGVGLSSTVERLAQLYGDDHRLTFERGEGGGLRVVIDLPFRTVAPSRPEGASA